MAAFDEPLEEVEVKEIEEPETIVRNTYEALIDDTDSLNTYLESFDPVTKQHYIRDHATGAFVKVYTDENGSRAILEPGRFESSQSTTSTLVKVDCLSAGI